MRHRIGMLLLAAMVAGVAPVPSALAQGAEQAQALSNQIEGLEVAEQGGTLYVRLTLKEPLTAVPPSFSVANPARIAFDFAGTANGLGRNVQAIDQGDLRSANIVQAGDRTRLVLNLVRMSPYETRVEGRDVIVAISPVNVQAARASVASESRGNFAEAPVAAASAFAVRDINFRRGTEGDGRVVVDLSSADTGIDIRQQGGNLVVDFLKTSLPEHLRRRSDVTDFGTPVTSMTAQQVGDRVRLTVTPNGLWEHNAYQSDNRFVLEVKRLVEDPNRLVQGAARGQYQGEKLSLNFQNVDVRSVLQVIADFTNFNIITSDSVQGGLTLRLKDVPWDQALDIILQAKGLDMRKNGNVIWVAPGDELAARERLQLEARAQVKDLEQLQTESFQINYHKAKEIFDFLKSKDQTMLSSRGSVVVDERSNKVFVTDVASRLDALRRLVQEIDVAPRQVLIEARIVEASKTFSREIGVRLGLGSLGTAKLGNLGQVGFGKSAFGTRALEVVGQQPTDPQPGDPVIPGFIRETFRPGTTSVNSIGQVVTQGGDVVSGRPVAGAFGALNLTLFNNSLTRFLNLELQALEADGRGRVVSSPRVLTANQVEASIEQGTEIPYQEASSSGATSVSFKKAVLALKVKPQITPDGRLQLSIEVNKDRPIYERALLGVPPIETKNVKSEVLVENGGTVVIGGIYEEEESTGVDKVPVLGDVPVLGHLFRAQKRVSDRKELLVFITPRIVADSLTLR
ncbi:type IV pilus secretin PilQ [Thauera mechernichensis]|uniref:Type IV pilus biogenesis and competence protein PilQ n=1 Tax=Thauera mechernichensis TaxID=82788 RepID=A0ABW3WB81_9RHOO|nr:MULTISPECIES: type IV pilus secretin PilQ [Thauera]MDG3064130.1 type IV pilus secretin PilQ [Thauera mechernichensis]WBL63710.1 type IV pilus secretin PilQ [Thauera sp. WB-2]HNR59810.1 type IV pilus secretin PilQ [Thauera sp.]HNS92675.1 type IV pilus secretin PilQ [Thauera sp.]HRJ23175.1 type IV pilus secretin PilQ [Thauera sp.]